MNQFKLNDNLGMMFFQWLGLTGLRLTHQANLEYLVGIWVSVFLFILIAGYGFDHFLRNVVSGILWISITVIMEKYRNLIFAWTDENLMIIRSLGGVLNWAIVWFFLIGAIYLWKKIQLQFFPWIGLFFLFFISQLGFSAIDTKELGFIGSLIQGESVLSDRTIRRLTDGQSISFLSRGLPSECVSNGENSDQVKVSFLIYSTGLIRIQVVGIDPQVYSTECVLSMVSQIRLAEVNGLKLIEGNLTRMSLGGQLYLEFYGEGPKVRAWVDDLLRGRPFSSHWSHARIWPLVLMVICIMGMVVAFEAIVMRRRESNVK